MPITRRDLLAAAAAGTATMMSAPSLSTAAAAPPRPAGQPDGFAYRYRSAFGAWINDMRRQPLPLEDWPAPRLLEGHCDDEGRPANIRRSVIVTLNLLNTLWSCLGEPLS
jgi:hypothetical protein